MTNTLEIGARLLALRGALTQAEFAQRLGVNRKTVVRWESGERVPDGDSLLRLVAEFGADANYLLTGKPVLTDAVAAGDSLHQDSDIGDADQPMSKRLCVWRGSSGARLRDERRRLTLTQTELAWAAGCKKNAQVNYESGRREPNATYLICVAAAGVDIQYVLTGTRMEMKRKFQLACVRELQHLHTMQIFNFVLGED